MKRFYLLVQAIIAFSMTLSAYDYQTVYSHRTALFANSNGDVLGMRIDSVKFAQDSVLYPLKNIQNLGNDCYTPQGASWLGAKIIVGKTWNYFMNNKGDTIKIKIDAKPGETWDAYNSNDITVYATVQKVEEVTFMGLKDSVKSIVLVGGMLTSSGISAKSKVFFLDPNDGNTLQISKRYGLLNAFDFLHFPFYHTYVNIDYSSSFDVFMGTWEQLNLIGLTNPNVGTQNLTWFDVYDFQVGDEVHTVYKSSPILGPPPTYYIREIKTIWKVLSRVDYNDSILYSIDEQIETVSRVSGKDSISYSHSNSRLLVQQNSEFDKLPTESVVNDNVAYSYYMHSDSILSKTRPSVYSEIWNAMNTNCWRVPVADGCFSCNTYYKGLGGPYYSCDGFYGDSQDMKLVYYKKGSNVSGVPLQITGIKETKANPSIEVYPNPTAGKLFVGELPLSGVCSFELLDTSGAVVSKCNVDANNNSVSLARLAKGLYLYRLTSNGKLLKTGKVVKN